MNDHITIAVRHLTGRAARPIGRWQRRLPVRLQAGDSFARHAGWTITRNRFGGRTYRDPRFGQPSATRTPRRSHEPARPPALGVLPAQGTSSPPSAPAGQMGLQGRS
jgi:hypothetical protein